MSTQTKGKCKYCGKEYTKAYMLKHLESCKKRKMKLAEEEGSKKCGYYDIFISDKYDKNYWMIIEINENATLRDLDSFLRDIWLECCGHLSSFEIAGVNYDVIPSDDFEWGPPAKSMDCKLKSVIEKGMMFGYEYDFGSSTDLTLNVRDYKLLGERKERLVILSRNNPLQFICSDCHKKPATVVCTECFYSGDEGFLCDDCRTTHECGEEMQLDVCNSPRMGVCGYCGSTLYPDQFLPDEDAK